MCCTVKTGDKNPKFRTRVAQSTEKHRARGRSGPFPEESKLLNPPRPEMGDRVVKRRETLTAPTPRGMERGQRKGPRLHRHQLPSLRPNCTPLPALSTHRRDCRPDAGPSSWSSSGTSPPAGCVPGPSRHAQDRLLCCPPRPRQPPSCSEAGPRLGPRGPGHWAGPACSRTGAHVLQERPKHLRTFNHRV